MINTEFIKEIRKKAIIAWAANNGITVHKFMDEPDNIEALEKFAELIINKCIDACYKANEIRNIVPPTQEQVVLWCIDEIEKKFGVK